MINAITSGLSRSSINTECKKHIKRETKCAVSKVDNYHVQAAMYQIRCTVLSILNTSVQDRSS